MSCASSVALVCLRHEVDALRDRARPSALRRRDLDVDRVVQQAVGEAADLVGEGRREEQVLPLRRQQREDAPDVADEAHVEHAVGLVEHEDLDVRAGRRCVWPCVVEQAARRGDQDVDAAAQRVDLRVDADAAEDDASTRGAGACRRSRTLSSICAASSRVGVRTSARIGWRAGEGGRLRATRAAAGCGSANAAVLPVPVWAPASTSRPSRTTGIACAWTGVGDV